MNYYLKYVKYKIKYLNLLGKTKRKLHEIGPVQSSEIKKIDSDEQEQSDKINYKDIKFEKNNNDEYKIERKKKLSSLFNLFTTENIFIPNPNTSELEDIKKDESNSHIHQYNLRPKNPNVNYVGTWTPELVKNLKSNGIDNDIIDELINQFDEDDKKLVEKMEKKNKIEDGSEAYIETGNKGKYIECWIADNMNCPCCGQKTLRRYVKPNLPCIDLMCINQEHNFHDGVKFFQVKAKFSEIISPKYMNFNYELKHIHTGSKNIGKYIHDIIIHDDFYNLLIGYICIEYSKNIDNKENENITITKNSFIVLPKINIREKKKLSYDDEMIVNDVNGNINNDKKNDKIIYDDYKSNRYYWYINNDPNKNIIEFNIHNNNIIFFSPDNICVLFSGKINLKFKTMSYNPDLNNWLIEQNPFVK